MEIYLGRNIEFLRKRRSLTQTELAQHLGKRKSAISTYEKGISDPPLDTLKGLSDLFKVPLNDLIFKDIRHGYDEISYLVKFISEELKTLSHKERKIDAVNMQTANLEELDQVTLQEFIRSLMGQLEEYSKIINSFVHLTELLMAFKPDGNLPRDREKK